METTDAAPLLPRAALRDVVTGRARLVGSRLDADAPRGLVSPVEARVALGLAYGDLRDEERARLARAGVGAAVRALASAAIGAALGGHADATSRRPFIVSTFVDAVRVDEAVDAIFAPPPAGRAAIVHFVHAHAINLAAFDADLRETLGAADLLLPDGIGLRIAGRLLGTPIAHNVNGTDLLPALCDRAADRGIPVVLIGAAPGVADRCAELLREAHRGLQIPIVRDGFLDEAAAVALSDEVRALGRCVVLVGMGTPRQERWSRRFLAAVPGATVVTVGGLFDFYSERIPRAPAFLREIGAEWAFRLAQEPRRLGARYLLGNPLFLALALRQRLLGR